MKYRSGSWSEECGIAVMRRRKAGVKVILKTRRVER